MFPYSRALRLVMLRVNEMRERNIHALAYRAATPAAVSEAMKWPASRKNAKRQTGNGQDWASSNRTALLRFASHWRTAPAAAVIYARPTGPTSSYPAPHARTSRHRSLRLAKGCRHPNNLRYSSTLQTYRLPNRDRYRPRRLMPYWFW